jgi:hypothetical protein
MIEVTERWQDSSRRHRGRVPEVRSWQEVGIARREANQMLYLRYLTVSVALSVETAGHTFSRGSTGANGALNCGRNTATVRLPASAVLSYATVNLTANCASTFLPNLTNIPVTISLRRGNRTPGPGGYAGGSKGQSGVDPAAYQQILRQIPFGTY